MRMLVFFVNAIYWLWLFIVPAGVLGFAGFLLYMQSPDYLVFSVIIGIIGVFLGFKFAEYVRKKHGLDAFFGKLLSMPELEKKDTESSRN